MPRIPGFLVAFLLSPLSAGAAILAGPEVPLSSPVVEPPAFTQNAARMATDGEGFLVVWSDESVSPGAVLSARLRPDGSRIDEQPLPIGATMPLVGGADVAFGAGRYFVAWRQEEAICGRFVMPDGTMSEAFRLSVPPRGFGASFRVPRVTFNGQVFLAGWREYSPNSAFGAAIVDPETAAVKTIALDYGEGFMDEIAVAAANGAFHFATWRYDHVEQNVGLTTIHPDGTFTARLPIGPASDPAPTLMAATGAADALFVWASLHAGAEGRFIHSVRIGEDGRPGPTHSFGIGEDRLHAVMADRDGYVLFHGSTSTSRARRAGTDDAFSLTTLADSRLNAGATSVAGAMLITEAAGDLFVHPLGATSFEPLATAQRHQTSPEIASAGTTRLAAWLEWDATKRRNVIAGVRVDREGNVLDPMAIEIAVDAETGPRIASNGANWLVVWLDRDTVKAARVARNGDVLDPTPLTIAPFVVYSNDVEVAWDGSSYVVVFPYGTPTRLGSMMTIHAARVTAEGQLLTPSVQVSPVGSNFEPAIAVSPAGSLVTWTDTKNGTLEGALLTRSDSVTPIAFPENGRALYSAAAWNANTGTFLVAVPFQDDGIRWFLVNANGIVTFTSSESLPWKAEAIAPVEVQPAGDGFVITYFNEGAIRAAFVSSTGSLQDAPVIAASTNIPGFGTSGSTMVYARPTDAVRDRLSRVFLRELQIVPDRPRRRAVR